MHSDIEEIKSRLDIVDVLRDYIRLEKAGANWRANCPFHNEKTPSFMVSADKQIWHCFGCGKGGDIFGFVMEIEGLGFREALEHLAEKAGIQLKKINPKIVADKNKTLELLELATKFYETQLWRGHGKIKIINYLKKRGLNPKTIKEFRLGYAPPGWRNLLTFLNKREYTNTEIAKTGLLVKKENNQGDYYDRFRERIIFPIADVNGKIVGFSARVAPGGDESQAKYVNTPETEVYHKSKILYGIDKAKSEIRNNKFVFLVEGNMDVIAASQAGIKNVVAVSGTALTPEQLGIIKRYTDTIAMSFDMDQAGEMATKKSLKLCLEKDIKVRIVTLPEGKDAAELAQKNPTKLKKSLDQATEATEYVFNKTLSKYDRTAAAGKRQIADEILDFIGRLANELEKQHWVKKLAESLEVGESMLTDMLQKAKIRARINQDTSVSDSSDTFFTSKKIDTLKNNLMGLMLVESNVWKKVCENRKEKHFSDSLFDTINDKGPKAGFRFDKLIKIIDDPAIIAQFEQIYFAHKYRMDLNNNLEELITEDPMAEMEKILKSIEREINKEKLQKITSDLKQAEESGDREAVKFLRHEFKSLSEALRD